MFLLLAYPRSRTAWLANFLTHGAVACGHELLADLANPRDLPGAISMLGKPIRGSAETAAALWLPEILEAVPAAKLVCILRPLGEVRASLDRLRLPAELRLLEDAMKAAARRPNALTVSWRDLDREETCRDILHHIAPCEPFERRRWQMLSHFNVQLTPRRIQQITTSKRKPLPVSSPPETQPDSPLLKIASGPHPFPRVSITEIPLPQIAER